MGKGDMESKDQTFGDEELLNEYRATMARLTAENKNLRETVKDYQNRLEKLTQMSDCAMHILDYALAMYGKGDIG